MALQIQKLNISNKVTLTSEGGGRRQRGRVVRAPDLKSGGPGPSPALTGVRGSNQESNSSDALVNSQLVCQPAGK